MKFKKITDVKSPTRAYGAAAGWDFYSPVSFVVYPKKIMNIGLGIKLQIKKGYFGLTLERSSQGILGITSSAKVIDSDYRGEIHATLANSSDYPYEIKKGDKIIQVIFIKHSISKMSEVGKLSKTLRGEKKYGSSGK